MKYKHLQVHILITYLEICSFQICCKFFSFCAKAYRNEIEDSGLQAISCAVGKGFLLET